MAFGFHRFSKTRKQKPCCSNSLRLRELLITPTRLGPFGAAFRFRPPALRLFVSGQVRAYLA